VSIAQLVAHEAGESLSAVRASDALFPSDFGGGLVHLTQVRLHADGNGEM